MAVYLRSLSGKVISNLNRKPLIFIPNEPVGTKFSIMVFTSRPPFSTQLFSKRNLGSIPAIKILEENVSTENQGNLNFQITTGNKWRQDMCCLNLHSFQPTAQTYGTACKHGIVLTNGIFCREVYLNNGSTKYSLSFGIPSNSVFSDYEKQMILLSESTKGTTSEPPKSEGGRPSPEQLQRVFDVLSTNLPALFVQPLDYTIYHPNIVLENHIRGTRTVGIFHYVRQVALLRLIGHFKFAYVKFHILKITSHPEDGTVKVRWRIAGISGTKMFLNFWKFKLLNMRESIEKEQESWYDGFSVFFIDSQGLVYKHVVDKMLPDPEEKIDSSKPTLATKLALMLGLTPRDCIDLSHVLSAIDESSSCLSDVMLPLDKIE